MQGHRRTAISEGLEQGKQGQPYTIHREKGARVSPSPFSSLTNGVKACPTPSMEVETCDTD